MILAQEQRILKGHVEAQVQQMLSSVEQAIKEGRTIGAMERYLWRGVLALGRRLMEGFVAGQGTGDVGPTFEYQGQTLRRFEALHKRRYVSVFGELTIARHVYGTRETQKQEVVPLDARLELPASDFSYLLQEWDQAKCVQDSYDEVRVDIQRVLGLGQSVRSLEQMNQQMAQTVESFRQEQPAPPAEEEGQILVVTADNKGIPMRREADEAAPRGRRTRGQKANKKRMACVGSVYTIDPFVREAQDVVDEVMRDKIKEKRPVPQHKEVRAELTREIAGEEVNGKDRIFAWFAEQAKERNAKGDKPVVCLMDGERSLWKTLAGVLVGIVCILDIFHVLERLWQAAHCFHPEGSAEAKAFVSQRLERILEGEVGRVIGGLKQMACKQGLKGARLKQLESAIGYLENNRQSMRYDEYLATGYPIGSGVAEGACRYVVKDRMERTGMRWRTPTAQAMLDNRCVYISGQWEAFNAYRIESEGRRLYPYRDLVEKQRRSAA